MTSSVALSVPAHLLPQSGWYAAVGARAFSSLPDKVRRSITRKFKVVALFDAARTVGGVCIHLVADQRKRLQQIETLREHLGSSLNVRQVVDSDELEAMKRGTPC